MSDPVVILCPGQGAQSPGMGKAWFDASPVAARTFGAADEVVGDRLGERLSTLCFEGPEDILNRTDVAQPAIFVTSVACAQALFEDNGTPFAATAGLSLGEYTALHLAGCMSFEDALELVILRGRAMQDAAEDSDGTMLALIGASNEQAESIVEQARQDDVLVPANYNAPGQVVLSGSISACERASGVASETGLRSSMLSVAGAFHSPHMQPAAERLREALNKADISEPRCPVLSNVTARLHEHDASSIRDLLVRQLTEPVRWAQGCAWMVSDESPIDPSAALHELAPGKVLAGLMRRIDRGTKVQTHAEPTPKEVPDA